MERLRKVNKFDELYIGAIIGLIIPFILFLIFYLIKRENQSFLEFINDPSIQYILTKVVSLCTLPDLGIFYLFINREMFKAGKGVILSVFIIVFWVIYKMLM